MACLWLTVSKLLKKLATEMIKNDQHLIFTKHTKDQQNKGNDRKFFLSECIIRMYGRMRKS